MKTAEKTETAGLRTCLRKYKENGHHASSCRWSIGTGGYDLNWQLSYDGTPVIDCLSPGNTLQTLNERYDLKKAYRIIEQEYGLKKRDNKQ